MKRDKRTNNDLQNTTQKTKAIILIFNIYNATVNI